MFCVRAASVVAQHLNQCLTNLKPLDMKALNIQAPFRSNKESWTCVVLIREQKGEKTHTLGQTKRFMLCRI